MNDIISPQSNIYCEKGFVSGMSRELLVIFPEVNQLLALNLKKNKFKHVPLKYCSANTGMCFSIPYFFINILTLSFAKDRDNELFHSFEDLKSPKIIQMNRLLTNDSSKPQPLMKKIPTINSCLCDL